MGELLVHEFMTLDGVVDEPTWSEDFDFTEGMSAVLSAIEGRSTDLLFGRRTYEMFEEGWADRTAEDDALAPFLNDTPKHVISSTLTSPTWRNTTVLGPYDPAAVRSLKARASGDIFCGASGTLVRAMIADGLVDEVHLFVYPLTRGSGPRLFPAGAPPQRMQMSQCECFDNGIVYLSYRFNS